MPQQDHRTKLLPVPMFDFGREFAVIREPAMAERMATLGMDMQENGTANYVQFMTDDLDRYAKVIDRLNLKRK